MVKRILKRAVTAAFVGLVILMSYSNCVQTERAIMEVEDFFIRTRTVMAAQAGADRAMMLVEMQAYENKDLKEYLAKLMKEYQRLKLNAEATMIRAEMLEVIAKAQTQYIEQLSDYIEANNLTVPPPDPEITEPKQCPSPSEENFFNSPKPTSPTPKKCQTSPGGMFPRSLTVPDAFGTAASQEV